MSRRRKLLLSVIGLFLAMQLYRPAAENPPEIAGESLVARLDVPADVAAIFEGSCSDCHSHGTSWPWYSRVAPISWLCVRDVRGGREHFNLSAWAGYTDYRAQEKLQEICEEVERGDMPLPAYLLLHREARLSDEEKARLCDWAHAARDRILARLGAAQAEGPGAQR